MPGLIVWGPARTSGFSQSFLGNSNVQQSLRISAPVLQEPNRVVQEKVRGNCERTVAAGCSLLLPVTPLAQLFVSLGPHVWGPGQASLNYSCDQV